MNLRQFSIQTGFSVSTVSKAFSLSKEISDETKKAIFNKAKELGVYEKFIKSKTGNKTVAVICPETQSAFYTETISVLNEIITELGLNMVVAISNFSKTEEENLVSYFSMNKRADGILILDGKSVAKKYAEIPVCYTNPLNKNIYADVIYTDFSTGLDEAIAKFKENGHKKIAYVGEKLTFDKLNHFRNSMCKYGMEIDESLIFVSDKRFEEAGYESMQKIFKLKEKPTAILAAYDYIALGMIRFLENHNKKVPDDISVIGIDDIKIASFHNVSLSSINANTKEICNLAIDILLKKMENKNYKLVQNVSVNTFLNDKNSIKNIK